jgi:hypothetical protein
MIPRKVDVAVDARVRIRRQWWTVKSWTAHQDCRAVRVSGSDRVHGATDRTFLLPFDRIESAPATSGVRAVGRRGWWHEVAHAYLRTCPFGGLRSAARAAIHLLPFQLEPALAVLRHARLRVLIADEVGLGKTVQAGILLAELSSRDDGFRGLVLCPAGLREQWRRELASKLSLDTTLADASWLASSARDLPADISPWPLPGVYVASLDLVKRPEVLRALEDTTWDLLVIDEVHTSASPPRGWPPHAQSPRVPGTSS